MLRASLRWMVLTIGSKYATHCGICTVYAPFFGKQYKIIRNMGSVRKSELYLQQPFTSLSWNSLNSETLTMCDGYLLMLAKYGPMTWLEKEIEERCSGVPWNCETCYRYIAANNHSSPSRMRSSAPTIMSNGSRLQADMKRRRWNRERRETTKKLRCYASQLSWESLQNACYTTWRLLAASWQHTKFCTKNNGAGKGGFGQM